jgi:transposase InsO family protein
MKHNDLKAQRKKAFRPKTTCSDPNAKAAPNHLADCPPASVPGKLLVSDITYIRTREGWLYLAVVIDLFSRRVLGWKVSDSMTVDLVLNALRNASDSGTPVADAVFHSDRGSQYSASDTRKLLKRLHLTPSMSAKGNCYDNAFAESFFASLKKEVLPTSEVFESRHAAATAVFDYIETFYNKCRLHSSLDYQSPEQFLNQYFQTLNQSLN